jgi:hypothetical protein
VPWRDIDVGDTERRDFAAGFRQKFRFLTDASVEPKWRELLERAGAALIDVPATDDAGATVERARGEGLLLLSRDAAYLDPERYPPRRFPTTVVLGLEPPGRRRKLQRQAVELLSVFVLPCRERTSCKVLVGDDGVVSVWDFDEVDGRIDEIRYRMTAGDGVQAWVEATGDEPVRIRSW